VFGGTNQALGNVVSTVNDVGTVNIGSLLFTNSGTLAAGQNAFFNITGGTLALNGSTITTTAAGGNNNPFGTNSNGDSIFSAITLAGTSTVTTNNQHNLSLAGNISGNGALVFDDGTVGTTEYVYLSGSNSYSGGTQIRGGFVQTAARVDPNTLQPTTSNNFAFGTGPVTVSDNGTLLLRNSSIISNPLTVSGSGSGANPANNSALVGSFGIAGQTAEYRGDITLAGDARFSTASAASGDTTSKLLVTGNVDIGPYLLTLRSRRSNVAGTLGMFVEITGTMSGAGGVDVAGEGTWSRVLISGSNSYSGGTTVTTGTLIVGNDSALGTGFLAVNTSGLDLNGQNLVVGALSGSSTGLITAGVGGGSSLRSVSSTSTTYSGTITNGSGTVGFALAGTGTLTLTGSNSYTGVTGIDGGVLALGSAGAIGSAGDVTFGGGTLRYTASNQVDYSTRIKNSAGTIAIDTNGETVSFASAIASSNTSGLTKTGSGTLYLNAANQYSGATTVDAGTLAGTGSVLGLLSVNAGAVFDPGSGPSATTIFGVGAFAQAAGGTTRMQITGTTAGTQFDQVAFSGGSKTVSWGGVLDLVLSGSYANFTQFPLFSGFTSQSGDLGGVSFAAPGSPYSGLAFSGPVGGVWKTGTTSGGQSVEFDQATGVLTIVPEPAGLALGGIGLAVTAVIHTRRRRRGRSG
jgi:autotransporter-associated beta strand protein